MTQHPNQRERQAIKAAANAGDGSARNYLELLDACIQVLEASNGISLARGMTGEHNDVYGHAIDDALSDLMPVVVRMCAGGWDGLKWYVSDPQAIPASTDSSEAEKERFPDVMTISLMNSRGVTEWRTEGSHATPFMDSLEHSIRHMPPHCKIEITRKREVPPQE